MRPELINRIDKIIVFRALTKKDASSIVDLLIDELRNRLVRKGVGIQLTQKAKEYLVDKGYDDKNGARPLRRLIQDDIEDYIADKLISGELDKGDILKIDANNGALEFKPQKEATSSKQRKNA